jgi:hypothetical protein
MVNTGGQLYTIEGIAAGLILLVTAFIVVNSTSVYTPGDSHLNDMQLEVIGTDALVMMDIAPNSTAAKSPLQTIVETGDSPAFTTLFRDIANFKTGSLRDDIQFLATVNYVRPDGTINSTPLSSSSRSFTGTEHAVRVTKWVLVEKKFPDCSALSCQGKHAALVEVLLWRD